MRPTPLLLALAVAAGIGLWFALGGAPAAPPADASGTGVEDGPESPPESASQSAGVPVMVLDVAAEEAAAPLALRGRTAAGRRVEVRAETSGRVISEPRRRGARVGEGEVLCRLDPGSRPARLAEAEARLVEARAEADAAESLSTKGFTAETTRFSRRAALQAAEAQVDLMRLDIERLEIRAPFAGRLETDTAELGALMEVGGTCASVVDLSEIRALGFVDERTVDRIRPGQAATVRLANGMTAEGAVSFVAAVADPDTRTYEVEARLPNPEGRLRDGMTAEIRLDLAARRAHRLPQSALTLDDEGRLGVRLVEAGHARFAAVEVLREAAGAVWVAGLPETARVIVVGQEFVRDGGAVRATAIGWDDLS